MGILAGRRPKYLGARDGKLAPCSWKPNCVSSQSEGRHFIKPMQFNYEPSVAWAKLKAILGSMPGVKIVVNDGFYLHAECSSSVLGFVDDVELLLIPEEKVCHIRSASRLGLSDLGVNRKRANLIRQRFDQ